MESTLYPRVCFLLHGLAYVSRNALALTYCPRWTVASKIRCLVLYRVFFVTYVFILSLHSCANTYIGSESENISGISPSVMLSKDRNGLVKERSCLTLVFHSLLFSVACASSY